MQDKWMKTLCLQCQEPQQINLRNTENQEQGKGRRKNVPLWIIGVFSVPLMVLKERWEVLYKEVKGMSSFVSIVMQNWLPWAACEFMSSAVHSLALNLSCQCKWLVIRRGGPGSLPTCHHLNMGGTPEKNTRMPLSLLIGTDLVLSNGLLFMETILDLV